MSITGFVKGHWNEFARGRLERRLSHQPAKFPLERPQWERSLLDPTSFYLECLRCFHQELPAELRDHRTYFYNVPNNRRGFGENTFHTMWYLLLQEFKPSNFLEIGVFRGQVISLVTLWAKLSRNACEVYGI